MTIQFEYATNETDYPKHFASAMDCAYQTLITNAPQSGLKDSYRRAGGMLALQAYAGNLISEFIDADRIDVATFMVDALMQTTFWEATKEGGMSSWNSPDWGAMVMQLVMDALQAKCLSLGRCPDCERTNLNGEMTRCLDCDPYTSV